MTQHNTYDVTVVGGGIHSVSIASEAASRGLKTLLVQDGDLASGASAVPLSVLTGDLRKLESFDLTGLSSNLDEISKIQTKAPHLIESRPFFLIQNPEVRSAKRVNTGIAVYRRIQPRWIETLTSTTHPQNRLKPDIDIAKYTDVLFKNGRFILGLAHTAQNLGAELLCHHRVIQADRQKSRWVLSIRKQSSHECFQISSKVVVNCCGWLANNFLETLQVKTRARATRVDYGHLYIRTQAPLGGVYAIQQPTKCLTYAYDFSEGIVCIGPFLLPENTQEKRLCVVNDVIEQWNHVFAEHITRDNIIHQSWCYRALIEDPTCNDYTVMRDSLLDLNNPGRQAPVLNLFGIEPTKHRRIAEQALDMLMPFTGAARNTEYRNTPIASAKFNSTSPREFGEDIGRKYPFVPSQIVSRLVEHYGTEVERILNKSTQLTDLGVHFGHGLYEAEVKYLLEQEWASTAEDILWRRSYLGMVFSEEETHHLQTWVSEQSK
ncbi:FAD-dependent oxidoreductase [Teredinibacter sp. KSP-S5-2]|uniref:FAD-dependent oxidoreductase n=1 Tax=Teredinibacter sp. KSP-S5-2 TaxID=3034506 RepID=UPI00293414CA|nr:FAD-dependent oxidoreductase [Teredinibacter sp. KSP-S5-2]WNO10097.1 FAD-dependent oxidoreductase [Teredinibacter sp. KSP-S5-2]